MGLMPRRKPPAKPVELMLVPMIDIFSVMITFLLMTAVFSRISIIQLDLLPTALAAAGIETKPEWKLDGVNLLPYLTGAYASAPHETLFWRMGGQAAVRKGDWKLVRYDSALDKPGERSRAANVDVTPFRLYDLTADPGEARDLSTQHPEKVKELLAAWESWDAQLANPLWGPGGGRASE